MTWVIALPTMFGYGVVISDIQVTLSDRTTVDCLQKLHRVSDHIVIGFAGSVYIGFQQVSSLQRFLNSPPPPQGEDWDPEWVVNNWSSEAKRVFLASPPGERSNGCSLIIASPHPNEDVGIDGFARIYVFEMKSPDFKPVRITDRAATIGSGNGCREYAEALKRATSNFDLMKGEMGFSGGYGMNIAISISDILRERPVPGISKHVHIAMIGRGRMSIQPNDHQIFGKVVETITMPPVAKNYNELKKMLGQQKAALAQAYGVYFLHHSLLSHDSYFSAESLL